MKNNRGSEWRKWDLHCHSLYSVLNNHFPKDSTGKISEEQISSYIDKIKKKDISAIGLTNYFKFTEEDYRLKKRLEKEGIATFLNLELRLSYENKDGQLFDYHIIFDNTLDTSLIETFLTNLDVSVNGTTKKAKQLTNQEIKDTANVDFSHLTTTLENESLKLKNNYLLAFVSRGHGSCVGKGKKANTVYENIVRKSDLVFNSSNEMDNRVEDRKFWLSDDTDYKPPIVQGSDAHHLEETFEGDKLKVKGPGSIFTWIKADLTFEGLRQILFEPEDRLSILQDKPEHKNGYQVIDSIKLGNDKIINFNPNLNTVIGGRSTGKSTLTNSIAKKLSNDNFLALETKPNTEKKKAPHVFDDIEKMEVNWKDNQKHYDLEFLPQNYMIKIAEDDGERNKLVQSIIKGKDNLSSYKMLQKYEENVKQNQSCITFQLEEYFGLKENIISLIIPEGDKSGIESQISKIKTEIGEKRKQGNFSEEDGKKFDDKVTELKNNKEVKTRFEKDLKDLRDLKLENIGINKSLDNFQPKVKNELVGFIEKLSSDNQKKLTEKVQKLIGLQEETINEISKTISEIENSELYRKGEHNIENNISLKNLTQRLTSEQRKLEAFEKFETEKSELEQSVVQKQEEILKLYSNFKVYRDSIKNEFEVKAEKVEIKLNFLPNQFKSKLLNGNSNKNSTFTQEFNENSDEKIKSIFEDLDLAYNQGRTKNELIKEIFTREWFTLSFELQYEGDSFDEMSQGKKAFVILSLILEFSDDKKPVIIDQPEDSLDNRAIYKDLTMYLKQKKKERQIIIVTHNPNIVIGADAENIIVANQHSVNTPNLNDEKFDYINGSIENIYPKDKNSSSVLENQSIRKHIFEILEGGREAFEKRENKYNLSKGDFDAES